MESTPNREQIKPPSTIGFVGLGNMGQPMVERLIGSGYRVHVHDTNPSAIELAVSAGASAPGVETLMGESDAVILMLPNSAIVRAVSNELLASANGNPPILIDMSSSHPGETRALSAEAASRDITFIDAPVSGGVGGAVRGSLTIMVGADEASFVRVEPLLSAMGTPSLVGEVGAGHALKALNNLLSATHLLATAEVMSAGERFGLDPETMLQVFNGSSGRSGSSEHKFPTFIRTGRFNSGFSLALMLKDMRTAVDLSAGLGTEHSLGTSAVEAWSRALAELAEGADHTEIARWVSRLDEAHRNAPEVSL